MMKIITRFFKKKEEYEYPEEYIVVHYNEMALRNGIEDYPNKIIIRYKYNYKTRKMEVFRVYGYSDSLLFNLRNVLKIPAIDKTEKETKFPIYETVNLDEITYKKN